MTGILTMLPRPIASDEVSTHAIVSSGGTGRACSRHRAEAYLRNGYHVVVAYEGSLRSSVAAEPAGTLCI